MNRYILIDLVQPEYMSCLNLLALKLQVFTHHRLIETHDHDFPFPNIADWKGEILPPYGSEAYDLFLENAVLEEDLDLVHIFYKAGGRLGQMIYRGLEPMMSPEIKKFFSIVNSISFFSYVNFSKPDSSIIVLSNQFIPIR